MSHVIPMTWRGVPFFPKNQYRLIMSAKLNPNSDTDAESAFQKESSAGLSVKGSNALIDIVPDDTLNLDPGILYCDIQAQHLSTGASHTVAYFEIHVTRDVTRETETSTTIYTSEPPIPTKGEKGDKGDTGDIGPQGPEGPEGTVSNDSVNAAIFTNPSTTRTALGMGTSERVTLGGVNLVPFTTGGVAFDPVYTWTNQAGGSTTLAVSSGVGTWDLFLPAAGGTLTTQEIAQDIAMEAALIF